MPSMPKKATDIRPGDRMMAVKTVRTISYEQDFVSIGWDDGSTTRLPTDAALFIEMESAGAPTLENLSKADLVEMAVGLGVDVKASMKKADLIDAIETRR